MLGSLAGTCDSKQGLVAGTDVEGIFMPWCVVVDLSSEIHGAVLVLFDIHLLRKAFVYM